MKAKSKSSYSEFRRMTSCNIIQAPVELTHKESQFNEVKRLSMELDNLSRRRTSSFTSETLLAPPPFLEFTTPFNIESPTISADRVIQRKISSFGQKPNHSFDIIEQDTDLFEDQVAFHPGKKLAYSVESSKQKQRDSQTINQFSAKQEHNPITRKDTVRLGKAITERNVPQKMDKFTNLMQKKVPSRKEGSTMLKSNVDKRALDFKKTQFRKVLLKDEMKPTRMLNEKEKAILIARIRGIQKLVTTSEIEASNLDNILSACANLEEQLGH